MAKDCSELAEVITEIAKDLSAQEGIETLDDIVHELQKDFPIISRQDVIDNILEATTYRRKQATEAQKKWAAIRTEAKADPKLKQDIEKVSEYLAQGEMPEAKPKPTRAVSQAIADLRKTRANLNKWLKTSDPAMKVKLQEQLDALNARIEAGDVVVDEQNKGKLHETLQAIQAEVEAAKRQIASEKSVRKIQDQIDGLEKHLAEGTLPEKKARPPRGEGVIDSLRNVRDELKKQLAQSEPARKQRLEKQIADMETLLRQIEEGTYEPPVKPAKVPGSEELQDLEFKRDRLRRDVRMAIDEMKPRTIWQKANPFDFMRDLMTTGEFSFIARQGGFFLFGHPVRTAKQLPEMLSGFWTEQRAAQIHNEMMEDPQMRLLLRAGLHISPIGPDAPMTAREEFALSRLAYKLPIISNFTRAGALFLNRARVDAAKAMLATLTIKGEPTAEEAKAIVNFANVATGRGVEGGAATDQIRRVFFSYQYLLSRLKLLVGHPLWKAPPEARKLIAKEYGRMLLGLAAFYGLAWLAGGDIEEDPTSSDAGKIRFGRHRIDPLMGLQQLIVFGARMITGERTAATTGKVTALRGPGVQYGQKDASAVITDFLRSKLHPLPGFLWNMAAGEKMTGEPTTLTKELVDLTHPMTWDDVYHAMEEDGVAQDVAVSVLGFVGLGLQTFQPEEWQTSTTTPRRRQ